MDGRADYRTGCFSHKAPASPIRFSDDFQERLDYIGALQIIVCTRAFFTDSRKSMRDSNLEKLLGVLLQERRTELKLTQDGLAKKAGLHRTHISLLERGERSPTVSTFVGFVGR
jgi:DNA-binding XRE family transcriptional regulator